MKGRTGGWQVRTCEKLLTRVETKHAPQTSFTDGTSLSENVCSTSGFWFCHSFPELSNFAAGTEPCFDGSCDVMPNPLQYLSPLVVGSRKVPAPALWASLLDCFRKVGRLSEAVEIYEALLQEIDPGDPR